MDDIVRLIGLTKSYNGSINAVDNVTLTLNSGRLIGLLGPNGSGKTTLIKMIAGLLVPTSGSILIDGRDMSAASQKEKDRFRIEKIGYVFQDFKLIDEMTVEDNIGILRLEGIDVSGMDDILRSLGIHDKKNTRIRHLSGGQKQRVAIARALVKKPDIILADEPTGNLNFAIGEQVMRELAAVSRGKTLIAVSHDDRLSRFFDEIIDMDELTSGIQDTDPGTEVI